MSNANEPDQVNTGALATTIGIVALATLGVALTVTALVRQEAAVLGDARQGTQERGVRELRADQLSVLDASPTWKDKAAGVVTLPIGRAMDWMVEAVRKDPKALSPWQPPAPKGLGGAGPEGDASAEKAVPEDGVAAGTGGAPSSDKPGADKAGMDKASAPSDGKTTLGPAPTSPGSATAAAPPSPVGPAAPAP